MEPTPAFLSQQVKRGDYFFLDLTPDPQTPLAVVCGGREVCAQDYLVDRAGFRWWSVEFVASGRGTATLGSRTVPLLPGTVLFYGPSIPHRFEVDRGSSMVKYFVDFVGPEGEELVRRAFPDDEPVVTTGPWVQRLFEDLKAAAQTLGDSKSAVCALLVRQLLTMLPDKTLSATAEDQALLARFGVIKTRLAELALGNEGVEDAARACGVSTSYLARLFRRFDRESPHRYLVRCRMAFAASLLLDPRLLVKEVASLTGYEDQYHFSRLFKSVYGRSPDAFRKLRS